MMVVTCIPLDDHRTTMLLTVARDFMTSSLLDPIFHKMNARIANEDKTIIESSFPAAVPPAKDEKSVRTDGFTLAFRKRYFEELATSSARESASVIRLRPSSLG